MIGGEEHCVFFSLGVIDELQSRFGKTVGQLLVMLKDPVEGPGYLREIRGNPAEKRKKVYKRRGGFSRDAKGDSGTDNSPFPGLQ